MKDDLSRNLASLGLRWKFGQLGSEESWRHLDGAYEEVTRDVLKITSYEKVPDMKDVCIVEMYNFAFEVTWIQPTMQSTEI